MSHFRIESTSEPGRLVLRLSGVVDELADLGAFACVNVPELRLELERVRRINSFGVRSWIEAMRQVPRGVRVVFANCSPPVVEQCNMVSGFVGQAEIESFYVPMICAACEAQVELWVTTETCRALGNTLPATPCPCCERTMVIDDLEEQYLLFLRGD